MWPRSRALENSMATEVDQKAEERLREVSAERQRWIAKREEALARKERLQKLLQLQGRKNEREEPRKANKDAALEEKEAKAFAAALARKKELKELQEKAETAREKQRVAANLLARNMKQLQAKRKRDETDASKQPRKKVAVDSQTEVETAIVVAPEMYPFVAAPDLDVGTAELARAACFRIAIRYLMQTGAAIPREKLEETFKIYTGKELGEVADWSSMKYSLEAVTIAESGQMNSQTARRARRRPECWQPGRQFLKTPTFITSDADRIQSLITLEKNVVATVCDSEWQTNIQDPRSAASVWKYRQKRFLANFLTDAPTPATLSTILASAVGVNLVKSDNTSSRICHRSHGQMAGTFEKMETWLSEQTEMSELTNTSPLSMNRSDVSGKTGDEFFASKYAKPFSVSDDSVLKQLRETEPNPSGKTVDPMKILCQYELNGVCKDKNCSNSHQKDYEFGTTEMSTASDAVNALETVDDGRILKMNEVEQLLMEFTSFRGKMLKKWPVITAAQTSTATEETHTDETAATSNDASNESGAKISPACDGKVREGESEVSGDFILLDTHEDIPETGDARYYNDIVSRKKYGDMLLARVEKDTSDADAWLLFAIYQLEVEVGVSDEAANLSDNDRLQLQLLFICKELNLNNRAGSARALAVDEANLKRCLSTLSRALEIEENAYCEALWLLYLRLCGQVTSRQTEVDMAEQAVQFLPNSHVLWLRYISVYDFDSVGTVEKLFWRLLAHISRLNTVDNQPQPTPTKETSILLTAMTFHLCIKLWCAGATARVHEILSALLFDDMSSEFAWCDMVRGQLRELPGVVEHWVTANSDECIPVKGLAYTAESLQYSQIDAHDPIFTKVLASYELAYQAYENGCDTIRDTGNVILSNWMLLLSVQGDRGKNDEPLKTFFEKKIDTIRQHPGASLIAAKVMMGLHSFGKQFVGQLMLTMLTQSSDAQFPEALHHYLFACREFTDLVNDLDAMFPDVMIRLARLLNVDTDKVEKSVQDIKEDTSNISKSRSLKTLLEMLLETWMGQLVSLRREAKAQSQAQSTNQMRLTGDIYVALDICHLMGSLLENSVAIDGIQMILNLSSFAALSSESRQLVWMQRFVFDVDQLQQEKGVQWREQQARLTQLFRVYMKDMSVEAEMTRQVSRQLKHAIDRNAVADAVINCLYPERNQLISYDVNLELFRLCLTAVSEKAAFHSSFTDSLALSSEFSLAFSDAATHKWELLAARATLRKALRGSRTQHSQILQALVAVELRLRNMKAVSSLLQSEVQVNPLLLESWRLVVGLEVLFGEKLDERAKKIAEEMESRQLVLTCNTFGDDKLSEHVGRSQAGSVETGSLSLRGLGLEYLPNSILLQTELVSLNISGNELVELPTGLSQLKNLQELDASENALIEFPASIISLTELKYARLAHNNITAIPAQTLPHLKVLDIRWNAVSHLPASTVAALSSVEIPQGEENIISKEVSNILDLSGEPPVSPEEEDKVPRQSPSGQHGEVQDGNAMQSGDKSIATTTLSDGGKSTIGEGVSAMPVGNEDDGDQIMTVVENLHTRPSLEDANEDQILATKANVDIRSKPGDSDMVLESFVRPEDSSTSVPPKVSEGIEKPNEVIELGSPESPKGNEHEMTDTVEQTDRQNTNDVVATTEHTTLTDDNHSTDDISEAEKLSQNHAEDTISARHQSRHDATTVAQRKLATYMEQNHIENRSDVRRLEPVLWREFLAATLPIAVELTACRMCFTHNDGHNQRFNSTILCVRCLEEALQVLKDRHEHLEETEEIV
ncbi:Plant intracellular Ras-group-related LRR protein 2 [Phytophthora citrophthora]|uniref:Plant intracellular Ras-group-related LRR protein 2 n=1 Tax=Phytophthora citrophthora TaxID=4793 RepID=A0AAD9LBQ5_9STRA|nr:Plant intracellular Ras-group-related LRR protein 2 [Phytophthora citrophthora]